MLYLNDTKKPHMDKVKTLLAKLYELVGICWLLTFLYESVVTKSTFRKYLVRFQQPRNILQKILLFNKNQVEQIKWSKEILVYQPSFFEPTVPKRFSMFSLFSQPIVWDCLFQWPQKRAVKSTWGSTQFPVFKREGWRDQKRVP